VAVLAVPCVLNWETSGSGLNCFSGAEAGRVCWSRPRKTIDWGWVRICFTPAPPTDNLQTLRFRFFQHIQQIRFACSNYGIAQMFVMRETWQVGEVGGVVIAEQEFVVGTLQMVAIPQRFKRAVLYDECFVDFQQRRHFQSVVECADWHVRQSGFLLHNFRRMRAIGRLPSQLPRSNARVNHAATRNWLSNCWCSAT